MRVVSSHSSRSATPWIGLLRFPLAIFLVLLSVTLIVWRQEKQEQTTMLRARVASDQIHAARRFELVASSGFASLQRLAQRRHPERLPTQTEYDDAVKLLQDGVIHYELLAYLDSRNVCRYLTFTPDRSGAWAVGDDVSRNAAFAPLIERARSRPRHLSSLVDRTHPDQVRLMIHLPIGGGDDGIVDGAILAQARIDGIIDDLVEGPFAHEYQIEIADDQGAFFVLPRSDHVRAVAQREPLYILDNRWYLNLNPTEAFIVAATAREPRWVLLGGTVISLLVAAALFQAMHHRWRDAELTRRHVAALESVNQIAAAITDPPASLQQLLDRLASEPRQLLGVTRSFIALYDPDDDRVRIVSSSEDSPLVPEFPQSYTASEPPGIRMAIQQRKVIVSNDVEKDAHLFHIDVLRRLSVRSLMMLPLIGPDRVIGLWTVTCDRPNVFPDVNIRLAGLWASQIALTLINSHYFSQMNQALQAQKKLTEQRDILHQQSRRDAETKAMLLRELNHRVKNNLAGIISLLTIGPVDLPVKAQQWLDRAVERIAMMARAHEMFAGGLAKAALRELIDQMLPSLSVVKPPGVELHADVSHARVFLRTERAVSLAMALHELCYNAIVHGVQDHGTVRLTARCEPNNGQGVLIIDVINDAPVPFHADSMPLTPGLRDPEDPDSVDRSGSWESLRSGVGLKLVAGLVRRELRGQFSNASHDGKTVARVEFPLLPDEMHEEDE